MRKNQSGLSAIEILVVIVIIVFVSTVGWLVYDRQKNNNPAEHTETTENKIPTSTDNQKYLDITSWGVKVPLSSTVNGLSYKISGKVASFRTTALNDVSDSCESNSINVARGKANEVVPNELDSDDGDTFITVYNNMAVDNNNLTTRSIKAKVGDYYFVAPSYAGASCASSANADKETDSMLDIVKVINQIVAQ